MDVISALMGLIILAPIFGAIALAIVLSSGPPILFRQSRTGRLGRDFELLKFRTMTMAGSEGATGLTQRGDSRVTRLGRLLRRYKMDELPQLVNVLRGDMTLVGPRPDLKQFWDVATEADRQVLDLTPGLTGAASLLFCDEESLLGQVPAEGLTSFYVERVLPVKSQIDRAYAAKATVWTDLHLLSRTISLPLKKLKKQKKEGYARISRP